MIVNVTYHLERDGVWAESTDVDGLAVAGSTLEEVRELVQSGLPFYLDVEQSEVDLAETVIADTFSMPAVGPVEGFEVPHLSAARPATSGSTEFIEMAFASGASGTAAAGILVPEPA